MLCFVARSNDKVLRFPIPRSEARIGRSPTGNDIVLPFHGVSRTHALLTRSEAGFRLTDLGSKNGVLVDGTRVPDVLLQPGIGVQIGSAVVSIEEGHTSDFDIAFSVRTHIKASASEPRTATLIERASEADALKLVRDIERGDGRSARDLAEQIVTRACRILRAASVRLLAIDDDVAIAATAGCEPGQAEVAHVVAAARAKPSPDVVIERLGNTSLLFASSRHRGVTAALMASFPGRPRAFGEWEKDFFAFIATKLLRSEPRNTGQRPSSTADTSFPGLVWESPAIRGIVETVLALSTSDRPILLLGKTGTGKEVFARLLHTTGPFARGPFLAVNCAELPDSLLESELFGIDQGVATGVEPRDGLFAAANGGTLFLDEIGEMGPAMQASLLRVLERREVRRVGARHSTSIRLRIVLATRREVAPGVDGAGLRDDLFYRCFPIRLPPLSERRDDILPLALHFIERTCDQNGIAGVAISRKTAELLLAYDWPGNIRELEHAVERAVLQHRGEATLRPEHFPEIVAAVARRNAPATALVPAAIQPRSLKEERDDLDRAMILRAISETGGNQAAAARILGVSRNGLAKKMRRLRIPS